VLWAVAFQAQVHQFSCSKDASTAISVESAMKYIYDKMGIAYHTHVTTINKEA
jgi:hypothetical protein